MLIFNEIPWYAQYIDKYSKYDNSKFWQDIGQWGHYETIEFKFVQFGLSYELNMSTFNPSICTREMFAHLYKESCVSSIVNNSKNKNKNLQATQTFVGEKMDNEIVQCPWIGRYIAVKMSKFKLHTLEGLNPRKLIHK